MLYALFKTLQASVPDFNLFRYITVRTALAGITAMVLVLFLGPAFIRGLRRFQVGQFVRSDGPASHLSKQGTPTMGGLLIITATIVPVLLWGNMANTYVLLTMGTMIAFGGIGFLDDYMKVRKKQSRGLFARSKLLFQILLAAVFALFVMLLSANGDFNLHLFFPILKRWAPYLGWLYAPWIVFIVVSSTNAVNLADGLDGLAIGLTLIGAAALTPFFLGFGAIAGIFLGGMAGLLMMEMVHRKRLKMAFRASLGMVLGRVAGICVKGCLAFVMVILALNAVYS